MSTTTRLPESKCATCGYKLDAATMLDGDDAPKVGDLTVCMKCGALCRFAEGMRVERFSGYRSLPRAQRRDIDRLRAAIKTMRSQS